MGLKAPVKFRRALQADKGRGYVLKRIEDNKYLEVWGWGVRWADKPSVACPVFRKWLSEWHFDMLKKYERDCTLESL